MSIGFILAAFFFQSYAWNICLNSFGVKLSYLNGMYLFSLSALVAYIPGKIPGLLLTANVGKKFNISPYLLGIGIFHFHLFSLGTVLFLSLTTLTSILTIQISIYFILFICFLFISFLFMVHKIFYLNKYLNYLIKKFNIQIDFALNIKKEIIFKIFFFIMFSLDYNFNWFFLFVIG